LTDPLGDYVPFGSEFVDIVKVEAGADSRLTIRVTFSPDTVITRITGIIDLDTDQNPATGNPATANLSLGGTNQDIGSDYVLSLFTFLPGRVLVGDAAGNLKGSVWAIFSGQTMQITIPLSMISDDGTMNIGMALGDLLITDAAPNSGHGTITGLGPCPATVAVSDVLDGSFILDTLYRLRDEVMLRNAATKQYVDLYYKHAREMSAIMLNTPWLRLRVAFFLWRQRSTVLSAVLHQPATMQEADAREIDDLIGVFLERAGPGLSNDLKTIRQAVRDRSLLTLFGVRVIN
jgi:hypothetical protein